MFPLSSAAVSSNLNQSPVFSPPQTFTNSGGLPGSALISAAQNILAPPVSGM